ncbi:hypothetical protein Tco_0442741 [Tanacetum coccineum]
MVNRFRDAFSVVFGLSLTQDTVMSDSEDSTVTYIVVSSLFGGLSDIGSPGVDGPPVMLEDPYSYVVAAFQAPPSPDYVSGPEYPPSPDFVLELVYLEFMPPEDEVLPVEEQPLLVVVSPTADSPGYVLESDHEEDPEEDDDEDPEEDLADYPADRGDDDDDEDESFDDDEDDDVDIKGDEEEEKDPAPADSTAVALPAVDQAPSAEETKPFETDESRTHHTSCIRVTAMISIREDTDYHLLGRRCREFLLATPLHHYFPYRTPPLHLLSTNRIADRPEVTLLPQKRLGIALGLRYEVGDSSFAPTARPPGGFRANYGFVATMDRKIMRDLERDVGYGITDTWDKMPVDMQDTNKIYTRLDDEQSERQLMAGRLNMLYRDRRAHACTARLMEAKARMSREARG